jgi:hypothetical protein
MQEMEELSREIICLAASSFDQKTLFYEMR